MPLQVYSTLARAKVPFPKKPGDAVSMYVCGPTVYKPSHIGHMVGPVIFDTVKRYLQYSGYKVTWVVNITDVDDKLIVRAKELKTTVPELAERMTQDYFGCLKALNVTGIDHFPRATAHIGGMIEMMRRLIAKDAAYAAGGDVYFDVSKDADYGKLCNRDPEQLEAGAKNELGDRKRNPGDFALWKGAKPGEPAEVQYDSPWGKGRPGWHIECSVMSQALLGETLDIHGGGLDLQFPHHENELAQSETDTGATFSRVWMHNGLLKLKDKDGKEAKMAGSIGNVLNVADALKHASGEVLRFFMLATHYRSPIDLGVWDWTNPATPIPDGIVAAEKSLQGFYRLFERYERATGLSYYSLTPKNVADITLTPELGGVLQPLVLRFFDAMDDDFNTGGAVGTLFELLTALNRFADGKKLDAGATPAAKADFAAGVELLRALSHILGLFWEAPAAPKLGGGGELVGGLMQLLIDVRNTLRTDAKAAAKDNPLKKALFDQTDIIRRRLGDLGVTLEDRPDGTGWRAG